MKSKPITAITAVFAVLILLSLACSAGFVAGRTATPTALAGLVETIVPSSGNNSLPADNPSAQPEVQSTSEWQPKTREELFAPFWEAWDLVHQQFVDQPVDDVALMRGAISGMMDALGDQHSSYMNPDQYMQAQMPLEQEYEGIGAWVDPNGDYLKIVSPMPDSPAEAAGLKAGDTVIAIDGEDMTGIDGNLVIRRVLGPAGTKVVLTIVREGEAEPFDVEVTRQKITIPSVDGEMLDSGVAYVQIITFADNTRTELRKELKTLLDQNPKGLIIDLRNNGGGYLDTAVEVASEFIGEGVVLREQFGDGSQKNYEAKGGGLATEIPLVVLVNEGSASASEILAGAIQDYGRGQLVGVTTYGKGSVQNWIPLDEEQGAVRITIARWLTPNGRQINEVGINPDVTVELTEDDFNAGRDPQLDKAVELLTQPGN